MLVKYDNKLNLLAFKGISKIEYDLFFAIIARLKNKNTDKILISFAELTEFIDKNLTNDEIVELLNKSVKKIIQTFISWETESKIINFTIFKLFEINRDNATLEVCLNEYFIYMLNNLKQGFSVWELTEFSSLASKYSQTLYRLLKQFKYTGFLKMDWDYFLNIIDAPKTYRPRDVDKWILKPAIAELSEINLFRNKQIFENLSYEKEYYPKRGRPIKSITFTFEPELKEIPIENGKIQKDHAESLAHKTRREIIEKKQEKTKKIIKEQESKDKQIKGLEEIQRKMKKLEKENSKQEQRFNPITNQEVDWRDEYLFRSFKAENKFENAFDICKIMQIIKISDGTFQGIFKNQENEKIFTKDFKSEKHFLNWFNKVKTNY